MTVPFLDLSAGYAELSGELEAALLRVASSGSYLLGAELLSFEAEFAEFVGARHCVGVGSGLDALTLTLRAWGIGPGDEVVVPGHTFIATWLAVSAVGARPVPVDVDADSGLVDPEVMVAAVGPRTRALVPVHLYGHPVRMTAFAELGARFGVNVLHDAAQAHGARDDGRPVGSVGTSAWSFYPGKNLGAFSDGGAVTTDDGDLANRLRRLRNYGSERKYVHQEAGVNSRLDELQAAVLRTKLRVLPNWNARRRAQADRYLRELARCPGLSLPSVPDGAESAWHLFVVRHPRRDRLRDLLERRGISTLIHYPTAPHRQAAYADLGLRDEQLPVTSKLQHTVLSLPIGPHLRSEQQDAVIAAVQEATAELAEPVDVAAARSG